MRSGRYILSLLHHHDGRDARNGRSHDDASGVAAELTVLASPLRVRAAPMRLLSRRRRVGVARGEG